MNNNQNFLEKYKALETLLRIENNSQSPVKDYEDTCSPEIADKLRYCRNTRNYIQHHEDADEFITVSKDQTAFLTMVINMVQKQHGTVGEHYKTLSRIKAVYDTDSVTTLADSLYSNPNGAFLFSKTKQGITYLGMISSKELMNYISKGGSLKQKIGKCGFKLINASLQALLKNDLVSEVNTANKYYLVLDSQGKICGIYENEGKYEEFHKINKHF